MLIGELSKLSGFSRDTIRFYEKQGLIQVGRKLRRFNNYKEYSDQTLQRLLQIRRMKAFGFTLNEATELLAMIESNNASCPNIAARVAEKVQQIDQKIRELEALKVSMLNSVQTCMQVRESDAITTNCPIFCAE